MLSLADTPVALTELLQSYLGGNRESSETLFREIFPALKRIASQQLSRERYQMPASPTELISELWLRTLNRPGLAIRNRDHFYAIVAIAMRRILIDLARARLADSRGGTNLVPSDPESQAAIPAATAGLEQIVEIGRLMGRLEKKDPLAARIVDMRYFTGYTIEETARILHLDERSVRHRWEKTSLWLKKNLAH